jgi:mannitol-specific phosphotransferase system IIBC component
VLADSLRQIMRILYTERPTGRVEKRSLFRLLGEVQIMQKYLLPLLIAYRDDPLVVFDVGTISLLHPVCCPEIP